jgi:UDP-GlcNAc:undecaprenyl-phosphate GlcNAc-1-phosphate transferase
MLMLDKAFKFTGKDLSKLSFMIVMATFLFGLPGLIMLLLLQWITSQSYAIESVDKHGISKIGASRLGGAAIFGSALALYLFGVSSGVIEPSPLSTISIVFWLSIFSCVGIGLMDDLKSNLLSPKMRLIVISLIFGLCLVTVPTLIPQKIGLVGLDFLLDKAVIAWMLTLVFCVGFVNAVNMADGANGLIPGIISIALTIFYMEVGSFTYAIFMTTCGLFTLFNVISGRLFLGDAGSYGLGSMVALNGLFLHNAGVFSAAFLAVLFAYPCIDILVTVSRRRIAGRSIFLPDNDHLHNRVHFHCQGWFRSKTLANSLTGIVIVSFSSGLALLGYTEAWWSVTSNNWAWIFLGQCTMYAVAFIVTGLARPLSQYVTEQ